MYWCFIGKARGKILYCHLTMSSGYQSLDIWILVIDQLLYRLICIVHFVSLFRYK
ncbi:hypothetical protein JCM19235_5711 [Vibrio maritimus]|uniref:Uncharacterized protein n=1 Tax=Vibrio maritimus TaxID=990268 RepID=A0A090SC91_9VIBR|nr:hypothetical protein JCM19235_5711 [Vibrio maritimus]